MIFLKWLFWTCVLLNVYIYFGYGFLLWVLVKAKRFLYTKQNQSGESNPDKWPEVSLVIAAYNEEKVIREKLLNCLQMDYPPEKLHLFVVSDGSDDQTPDIVKTFPEVKLFHQEKREGKAAAINRVMPYIHTPFTVYTDANNLLNSKALQKLLVHFLKPETGAVAGEKRVSINPEDGVTGAAEGIYWRYESYLKKLDARLHTVVGAAGELYAIRTALYQPIPESIINEDFYQTVTIAQKGWKVAYEPKAIAWEAPSERVIDEWKRRVRIAAGGWQAVIHFRHLLNPIRYGWLTFQYISHRLLRWTFGPLSLIVAFGASGALAEKNARFYMAVFMLQSVWYALTLLLARTQKGKAPSWFSIPFYFLLTNFGILVGLYNYLSGKQKVTWEKASRKGGVKPSKESFKR